MSYSVRQATEDEARELPALEMDAAQAFRDFGLESIADDEPWADDYYLYFLDATRAGQVWVAIDDRDGRVVGFAVAGEMDGQAYVAETSVRAAHARRGLGRRLMTTLIDWAKRDRYREVVLTTFRDIPFNAPFYRTLGFREIEAGADRPELAAVRQREKDAGIEIRPRIAMALRLQDGAD